MNISSAPLSLPAKSPEKILQFGTGVLLRGLCDFLIDSANRKGIFNGSIVVVKSMPGNISVFEKQKNLYTVCVRGVEKGVNIEENVVCSAISRVLTADSEWDKILETALNKDIDTVISNTTEVGLQYVKEGAGVPTSFPGKLCAWLYARFSAGLNGVVIIPTELVVDNGKVLKNLIVQQAIEQKLSRDFVQWIENDNSFCSSLVDRIVPGKPNQKEYEELSKELGYEDELLTISEVYRLWAIEGDEKIEERLSFTSADKGMFVVKDISKFRELKLRMLNAPHTLVSGLCYLSGFDTVKSALNDKVMEQFISNLMLTELSLSLPKTIDKKVVQRYGMEILDRFRNPYLDHKWHSITFQYTMKMQMRAVPLLLRYYKSFKTVPHYFARGFAAYLLFMKAVREEEGKYYAMSNGKEYVLNDDQAAWYFEAWKSNDAADVTKKALSNTDFWSKDLTLLPNFEESVATHLSNMMMMGVKEVAAVLNVFA